MLEDAFSRVLVVNARHVKRVPGRKTEQSDADWLCQSARERWMSIPGIGPRTAEVLVAELGVELPETFPTAGHLASWAGLAPATYESAGKRRPAGTTHGNKWVRGALYEAAMAATRRPETDLGRRYRRIHGRRGHKRAIVAVSHAILTTGWHLERDGALYTEPSPDQTLERERARLRRRALRQLSELGYNVELREAA